LARGAPQNFGFPYNISATAGASDFGFDAKLGFAKGHHKITRKRKSGRGPGLREASQNLQISFNIYTITEASDFKFGTQLGFAKAHHKITLREKRGRGLGLGKHPNIWGSPLIFLQRPRCLLSVSRACCFRLVFIIYLPTELLLHLCSFP